VNRALLLGVASLSTLALGACFIGYDSRWGETQRAQKRVAAQSGPATISASPAASNESPTAGALRHVWRIRVRPTARYLAETVDAPKQIADVLEDSNRVLEPALSLHLEMDRLQPWSRETDDVLSATLEGLRREDPGEDVDLVAGMIGSLSRHSDSFHELGMASMPGKHLLVRAAARADEHDAIDRAFNELSDDERARLTRLRKRHRALAVFLHEVGHCLGALHEQDVHSLMHPAYDTKMSGFGAGGLALMRVAVEGGDRVAVARAQLTVLRDASYPDWLPAERDEEAQRLQAFVDSRSDAAADPAGSPTEALRPPPELTADDADRFARARQAFQSGSVRRAYELAKPLFTAYPQTYAVQDLRCQLATVRWLPAEQLLSECAPYNRLAATQTGADAAVADAR
jgi:hypothetical protein